MSTKMLGSLEQRIMNILWASKKPLKAGDVRLGLGQKHAYTTIMTELKRMTDKKILKRELVGKAYLYRPLKNKAGFAKTCLCTHYINLVDSYGPLAISQFVDTIKNNPEDLKLLQTYLNDAK